jgi:hypothetical protein
MKRTALRLAAGMALIAGLTLTPTTADAAQHRTTTWVNTIVIGDSITFQGTPFLLAQKPTWIVDGVNGREVGVLKHRIRVDVAEHGTPHRLIIALGQNISPDWTKADYEAATELVPASTEIYFISTYRDPAVFGQEAADTEERYTSWMRQIAADRPHTHMIPWRARVIDGSVQLVDGSHPTDPEGRQYWADLVVARVALFD